MARIKYEYDEELGAFVSRGKGTPVMAGYVITLQGRHFIPDAGMLVDADSAKTQRHNATLSKLETNALNNPVAGASYPLYVTGERVETWIGAHVADVERRAGRFLYIRVNGNLFRGIERRTCNLVYFKLAASKEKVQ